MGMSSSMKRKRSDAAPGSRAGPGLAEDRSEPKKLAAACTACRKQKVKYFLFPCSEGLGVI